MRGSRAYRNLSDGQLGALVAERDGGALDELYVRYGEPAYALATRLVTDPTRAAKLVEDAFLTVWREAGRLGGGPLGNGGRGVAARLLGLVHSGAVEAIRRNERLRRPGGPDAVTFELSTDAAPSDHARQVRRALGQLPATERRVLALAYLGGYTVHEVAALTGMPVESVGTSMATGLRLLKDALLDSREQPSQRTAR